MRMKEFLGQHPLFTVGDFLGECGGTARSAESVLRYHVAAGRLARLRRGLYLVVPEGQSARQVKVDRFLLASKLAPISVLALHTALEFHRLADPRGPVWFRARERVAPTRIRGWQFVGLRTDAAYFEAPGLYSDKVHEREPILVTTVARTLAEVFDEPERSGGWGELARVLERVGPRDWGQVIAHLRSMGSAIACARLGLFLEAWREPLDVTDQQLAALEAMAPRQARYLETTRSPGALAPRWNLIVPAKVQRLLAQAGVAEE